MSFYQKIYSTFKYVFPIYRALIIELFQYYFSTYPFLRIIGTLRRIKRHLKIMWFGRYRGRPPVPEIVISLIVDMKTSNLIWGAKRISQELALLGLKVSKETVRKILNACGFYPPKLKFAPPGWLSLIDSCKSGVYAMDFTCVHDIFGKQIFIFVVLDHITRELILINATLNPVKDWVVQQIRNFHFDRETPEAMIFDGDGIYGKWLKSYLLEQFDIKPFRIPKKCPWWNGRVERFHKTLKDEIVRRLEYLSVNQLLIILPEYKIEYNKSRPHQSLNGQPPINKNKINAIALKNVNSYKKIKTVGGLINRFELVA